MPRKENNRKRVKNKTKAAMNVVNIAIDIGAHLNVTGKFALYVLSSSLPWALILSVGVIATVSVMVSVSVGVIANVSVSVSVAVFVITCIPHR